ncbi:hypothetical protein BGM09_08300 [Streptomyces sp. CBMA29]|nr:hypothetical protein [Streptomyces sp. CBMA29]
MGTATTPHFSDSARQKVRASVPGERWVMSVVMKYVPWGSYTVKPASVRARASATAYWKGPEAT